MTKRLLLFLLVLTLSAIPVSSFSEESIPDNLTALYNYFTENEADSTYVVSERPRYFGVEYQMELRYKEVPEYNGVAIVTVDNENSFIKICFQYSNLLGYKACAPDLVKSVCKRAIEFAARMEGFTGDIDNAVNDILNTYRDGSYGESLFTDNYAFVFAPDDYYMTVFNIIDMRTLDSSFDKTAYVTGDMDSICSGLNAGNLYYVSGKVTGIENGYVRTPFGKIYCIKASVTGSDGNSYVMIVQSEIFPVNLAVGDKGVFYGNVSSYTSGKPSLWIDYFEYI
jgi:hypothetical protein